MTLPITFQACKCSVQQPVDKRLPFQVSKGAEVVEVRGETGGAEVETEGVVAGVLLLLTLQSMSSHKVGRALY